MLGHEDDAEAVRILEREAVRFPIRVRRLNRSHFETCRDRLHAFGVAGVQHEQRFGMWLGSRVAAAGRQLEVSAAPRNLEKDAVVAVVVSEAADLGQAHAVSVELHDLLQALRMSRHAQLHEANATEPLVWLE